MDIQSVGEQLALPGVPSVGRYSTLGLDTDGLAPQVDLFLNRIGGGGRKRRQSAEGVGRTG